MAQDDWPFSPPPCVCGVNFDTLTLIKTEAWEGDQERDAGLRMVIIEVHVGYISRRNRLVRFE